MQGQESCIEECEKSVASPKCRATAERQTELLRMHRRVRKYVRKFRWKLWKEWKELKGLRLSVLINCQICNGINGINGINGTEMNMELVKRKSV